MTADQKKVITGGWGLICVGEDESEEGFEINAMTIRLIAAAEQGKGIKIIHRDVAVAGAGHEVVEQEV